MITFCPTHFEITIPTPLRLNGATSRPFRISWLKMFELLDGGTYAGPWAASIIRAGDLSLSLNEDNADDSYSEFTISRGASAKGDRNKITVEVNLNDGQGIYRANLDVYTY